MHQSLARYSAPVSFVHAPSLADFITTMVGFKVFGTHRGGREVAFKLEYLAPTGSFKDRGTSVLMTYLHTHGVPGILEDSSGNAGASMAAYTAACGMSCRILVPADAPSGKLVQMSAMGATVIPVSGTRQDVAERALAEAGQHFYASHNWQPFFI